MDIFRVDRTHAAQARGIVIVIDVIRAFSVAGYAFAGGALGLKLVRTTEEAFTLHAREPDALLAGEIDGRLIPGFDLNNSPALMAKADVRGRYIIQRTGAGTQGAVNATHAQCTLLCALTNAKATATHAQRLATAADGIITLLPTASSENDTDRNEDDICADYVEALLRGQDDAPEILAKGTTYLQEKDRFAPWTMGLSDFPFEDIAAVLAVDRFNFAMVGKQERWQEMLYVHAQRVKV